MTPLITIISPSEIQLHFEGRVVPKQRPRCLKNNRAVLPPAYRQWKDKNVSMFAQAWREIHSDCNEPPQITYGEVFLNCYGKFLGDSDNIFGSVLDVMVQAKMLVDDSLKHIPETYFKYSPANTTYAVATVKNISYYWESDMDFALCF